MYPSFKAIAEHQGEKGAVRTTHWALETEKVHALMYEKAKKAVEAGTDAILRGHLRLPRLRLHHGGQPPGLLPDLQREEGVVQEVLTVL